MFQWPALEILAENRHEEERNRMFYAGDLTVQQGWTVKAK
jgi:hypothetical protein